MRLVILLAVALVASGCATQPGYELHYDAGSYSMHLSEKDTATIVVRPAAARQFGLGDVHVIMPVRSDDVLDFVQLAEFLQPVASHPLMLGETVEWRNGNSRGTMYAMHIGGAIDWVTAGFETAIKARTNLQLAQAIGYAHVGSHVLATGGDAELAASLFQSAQNLLVDWAEAYYERELFPARQEFRTTGNWFFPTRKGFGPAQGEDIAAAAKRLSKEWAALTSTPHMTVQKEGQQYRVIFSPEIWPPARMKFPRRSGGAK